MWTYSSLGGGDMCIVLLYGIENIMVPYICFFGGGGNFTFAKVEH